MKISLATILMFFSTLYVKANDGVYMMQGGLIYPAHETSIVLEKEILSLYIRDGEYQVNILFECYNPEQTERKLMIGFQAPSAVRDVSDAEGNTKQITDFTVMAIGQIRPYQLRKADCADCA